MGQPDKAELIQGGDWTATEARKAVAARKPKTLGVGRDDKWWEAEKDALKHLRGWNEKRIAGLSKAEAKRRAEFVREAIALQEQIAETLETYSYTRSL